jgi:hypothetical protein
MAMPLKGLLHGIWRKFAYTAVSFRHSTRMP